MRTKKAAVKVCHSQIGHQKLWYLQLGDSQKPALVMLHGYGTSSAIWQTIAPILAQHYQLFMLDLPGFGRSDTLTAWKLREIAPLLTVWLQDIGIETMALMGHSMGGAISIHLTTLMPDRVEKLILVNAAGIPLQTPLPALTLRAVRSFAQTGNGRYPWRLVRDALQPRVRVLWQGAQEMIRSDFRAELDAINCPTLIVWGERDLMLPIELGYALHQALPHAQFKLLSCGHRPMLAEPGVFSEIVTNFLQSETRE